MRKVDDEMGILKEDNKQKEMNLKKIEEEIKLFEKENEELTIQLLQERKHEEKRVIQKLNSNYEASISEERINQLLKENTELTNKLNNLEKELKNKLQSISEMKERCNLMEKEKNDLRNKLKSQENLTEKLKNENNYLKKENFDLNIIIQNLERKGSDITENNFTNESEGLTGSNYENAPLNNLILEIDEEDDKPILRKPSKLMMYQHYKIRFSPKNVDICNVYPLKTVEYQSAKNENTQCTTAPDKNKLNQNTLDELDDFLEENQTDTHKNNFSSNNITVTPHEIVKKMSNNETSNIIKEKKSKSPIKNNSPNKANKASHTTESDLYKEFFHLTFLTFKLNSTDFEPFFYVNKE